MIDWGIQEWTKVGEIEVNRPASDSAVEVKNPTYSKDLGEFYQAPIDERGTDHLLTCYARAERDEDYDYLRYTGTVVDIATHANYKNQWCVNVLWSDGQISYENILDLQIIQPGS